MDPNRWGLPKAAVGALPKELRRFHAHFRPCFKTRTHNGCAHARDYWRGQLTMEDQRNFANIERRVHPGGDGQGLQNFMTDSPWSSQAVYARIQQDIVEKPALAQGGLILLDESADAKAGEKSAGAARQWNGRLGKKDVCQVAVCLAFAHPTSGLWTLVDGELFLPEHWFSPENAPLRQQLGIPAERTFQTKPQLGLLLIGRALERGLPFERVAADELYGRNRAFRASLGQLRYALEVPENTQVRLAANAPQRWAVQELAQSPQTPWRWHEVVRWAERGQLVADFAVLRVWTAPRQEAGEELWLVLRRDPDGRLSYTLLNDPAETPPEVLIQASCQRYLVECVFEEAKSELGWDDFCARKYRAWEHHTALTAAALWFIAGVKLKWRQRCERDPQLKQEFELSVLPALSTANVRDLLRSVMPLPQLSPRQAQEQVAKHLVNRARSTSSRWKKQSENSS